MDTSRNINELLVDDCLMRILEHLSLQELLKNRSVCKHWQALIESQILSRKRTLKLFGGTHAINEYCRNVASFESSEVKQFVLRPAGSDDEIIIGAKWFNEEFSHLLLRLFPKIEGLVVFFDWDSPFKNGIATLIANYKLLSLSLLGNIKYDPLADGFLYHLCQAINRSADSLTRLDLLCVNMFRSKEAIHVLMREMCILLLLGCWVKCSVYIC